MIACDRPPLPEILRDKEDEWGEDFEAARAANPACRFQWKTRDSQPVNRHLLPHLHRMTAHHCAYCDGFPLGPSARETIDHFRPKSSFPRDAYRWENLFLACDVCQGAKAETYPEAPLKPDERDYRFERYFTFNFRTGEIEPNTLGTTPADQERARRTIDWLGLNDHARPHYRLSAYEDQYAPRVTFTADLLETLPYRFLVTSLPARGVDFSG